MEVRLNKYGRFSDEYRGSGWFVSWFIKHGYFLLAFRPFNWSVRYARPALQPWVRRLYVGPIEIELSWYRHLRNY